MSRYAPSRSEGSKLPPPLENIESITCSFEEDCSFEEEPKPKPKPKPKPAEAELGSEEAPSRRKKRKPKRKPKPKTGEGVGEGRSEQAKEEKTVQCIRVHCKGEQGHWETLQLPVVSHPILSAPISPVSQRIGLPLRVYLEKPLPNPIFHPNRAHYVNQLITYLMIDPVSGFAPFLYQDGVGNALVCRSDLKSLSEHNLETVWKFCSHLIGMFGHGPDAVVPDRDITRPKFEWFCLQYKDEKAGIASTRRQALPKPKTAEGVGEGRSDEAKEEKTVQCIRVHCNGEPGPWETLQLPVSHPILSAPISPVSQRIGLPLRVYVENRAQYDNQPITYLMIDPVSGFAPFLYQDGVGNALVCRSDLKPLSDHHLEAVWQFCCHLIGMFGHGPDAVVPDRDITRPKFERFFRQYKDEKAGLASQDAVNWQPVGSPFDV